MARPVQDAKSKANRLIRGNSQLVKANYTKTVFACGWVDLITNDQGLLCGCRRGQQLDTATRAALLAWMGARVSLCRPLTSGRERESVCVCVCAAWMGARVSLCWTAGVRGRERECVCSMVGAGGYPYGTDRWR